MHLQLLEIVHLVVQRIQLRQEPLLVIVRKLDLRVSCGLLPRLLLRGIQLLNISHKLRLWRRLLGGLSCLLSSLGGFLRSLICGHLGLLSSLLLGCLGLLLGLCCCLLLRSQLRLGCRLRLGRRLDLDLLDLRCGDRNHNLLLDGLLCLESGCLRSLLELQTLGNLLAHAIQEAVVQVNPQAAPRVILQCDVSVLRIQCVH